MTSTLRRIARRYHIERVLGEGGMARVYLALDSVLGRRVAVKVLRDEFAAQPTFIERFAQEARLAARVAHPTIVSVYDAGSDGGRLYIVMEYVPGKTLADYIRERGPLAPHRASAIAVQVAQALSFAHAAGLVHRDVKPGNIIITSRDEVKVTDFGIARVLEDDIDRTLAILGSAPYMSPEQAQGVRVDSRSDIYSLGVVLYEMTTGRVPFSGETPVAVAHSHVHEAPLPPSELVEGLPEAIEAVIMRALAKDPDGRFATAQGLGEALEEIIRSGLSRGEASPDAAATQVLIHEPTRILPEGAYAAGTSEVGPTGGAKRGRPVFILGGLVIGLLALVAVLSLALLRQRTPADGSDSALLSSAAPTSQPSSSQPDSTVEIPNVLGYTLEEARSTLEGLGIIDVLVDFVESGELAGTVIDQRPPPGSETVGTVTLVVAETPTITPTVVGMNLSDALEVLHSLGVDVSTIDTLDEEAPDGTVLEQEPTGGSPFSKQMTLTIARRPIVTFLRELEALEIGVTGYGTGIAEVSGTTYADSVWLTVGTYFASPDQRADWTLGRDYRVLRASVGLADDADADTRVRFEIRLDGRTIFDETLRLGQMRDVELDVTDGLRLQFLATAFSGRGDAVLGDARLIGVPDSS